MDFFNSLVAQASQGVQKLKSAATGTLASAPLTASYPAQGARRRGKKTKKAGRRKKRTMRWY